MIIIYMMETIALMANGDPKFKVVTPTRVGETERGKYLIYENKNEGQMTAVEYLKHQYIERGETLPSGVFEEALKMEREEMKEMYLKGIENYDPTFKRKSQWTEVDNMTKRLK